MTQQIDIRRSPPPSTWKEKSKQMPKNCSCRNSGIWKEKKLVSTYSKKSRKLHVEANQ